MTQATDSAAGIKRDEFDPELAKAIWNPASVSEQPAGSPSWYFICNNVKNGTRFTVEVQRWMGGKWYVQVDIETLDAPALRRREVRPEHHLTHLRFKGICEFEYNEAQHYVQFNRRREEGEDEHYVRIFASGYVFSYV